MKTTTIIDLQKCKQEKKRFAAITAYDYSFAKLFSESGINILLIGDSLGMTIQGYNSTIPVTIQDIIYHTKLVRRGAINCFLISDLPFLTYSTLEQAFKNAAAVMKAGANMIKIEGGSSWLIKTISMLVERSVPVCGHLGLTPQSINVFGEYKVQGRSNKASQKLFEDSLAIEIAGAQLLILECIPIELATKISESLSIPVIGIGSGNATDGQILVMHDVLGITTHERIPTFAKNFLSTTGGDIRSAIKQYISDVECGLFPGKEHSFH